MALRDFWENVQSSRGWISPKFSGPSSVDAERAESEMRRGSLWLTSRYVDAFDEADFSFLPDEERHRLASHVHRFREIAEEVPDDRPATEQQVREAAHELDGIFQVLSFNRYADPVAFELGKKLEREIERKRPEWLEDLRFETGEDVTGSPALWVWMIVDDDASVEKELMHKYEYVRKLLERAAGKLGLNHWLYIRLRTAAEQAEIAAGRGA